MLFPRIELDAFAFGQYVDDEVVAEGLDRLGLLQDLYRTGHWRSLSESMVEQSFVERVFGDVFNYQTLLGSRRGVVEAIPKLYVPLRDETKPRQRGVIPDLALGFFRADVSQTIVSAEFKGPDADL